MATSDSNLNSLKTAQIEQLFKIIQQQAEQIETQKIQISALIKSQQTLLESMRPPSSATGHINPMSMNFFNVTSRSNLINSNLIPSSKTLLTNSSLNTNNGDQSDQLLHEYNHRLTQHKFLNSSLNIPRSNQPIKSPHIGSGNLTPTTCPSIEASELRLNDNWANFKSLVHTEAQNIIKKEVADQSDTCNISELPILETDPNEDDEEMDLSSLQEFAAKFKMSRIEMGFTQRDVGVCLGLMQGNDFSQTTLSRFEALNLSYRNMRKLQPLLQRWLDDIQKEGRDAVMGRITAFYQQQKAIVEEDFDNNDLPTASGSSRKRIANESAITPDDLSDERNSANADSTTMNSKLSQNQLLRTCMGNISNSLSPTLLNNLANGFSSGFSSTLSANFNLNNSNLSNNGLVNGFPNLPFQSALLHDQTPNGFNNRSFSSQKKRRKRILVTDEVKSRLEMFPEDIKVICDD